MKTRDLVEQAGWLVGVGLLVSAHRLAVGFALSDGSHEAGSWTSAALLALGALSAIVLTGAQMILAATLAVVRDRLLEAAWTLLVICAVVVMSASTLSSMNGVDLATVLEPAWLAAHLPAMILAIGLSLAIEIALASVRRASMLLERSAESDDGLGLTEAEAAEWEVQAELSRARDGERTAPPEGSTEERKAFERECPWCDWRVEHPSELQAMNAVKGHQRHCSERPALIAVAAGG